MRCKLKISDEDDSQETFIGEKKGRIHNDCVVKKQKVATYDV
jgi:hypothetical protein